MTTQPNPNDELREKVKAEVLNNAKYTYKLSPHNFDRFQGDNLSPSYEQSLEWTVDQVMQALHAHMKAILQDVIGEDTQYKPSSRDSDRLKNGRIASRNALRAEQRQRVAKWLPKEEQR